MGAINYDNILFTANRAVQARDWARAAYQFEFLSRSCPDNAQALECLALCYRHMGFVEKAEATLKLALLAVE